MPIPVSSNRLQLETYKTLGIKVPILKAARDGIFETTTTTLEKIKSQLYVLLFTSPGERVCLPDFGINVHAKLFDNIDEVLLNEIRKNIRLQISKYIPEITVKEINFLQTENKLDIEIQYFLNGSELIYDNINVSVR
jgi:phage baseplate assembly protein W